MKIACYYVTTGPYKEYFPGFLQTLQNFFPNATKVVKLISDGLEEYRGYQNGDVIVDLCPRINHYPWPIVTLYKHWHILQNWDDTCDYVCYFNGNALIRPNNPDIWCDLTKINVSYHSWSRQPEILYPDSFKTRPDSAGYLEPKTFDYTHAGFFFGPNELIKEYCEDVTKMVNEDSKHFFYAEWHDETYSNKWVETHLDKVHKEFIMTALPEYLSAKTFIFLQHKNSNIDKFKTTND